MLSRTQDIPTYSLSLDKARFTEFVQVHQEEVLGICHCHGKNERAMPYMQCMLANLPTYTALCTIHVFSFYVYIYIYVYLMSDVYQYKVRRLSLCSLFVTLLTNIQKILFGDTNCCSTL